MTNEIHGREELKQAARSACSHAHAPYSGFSVGAVVEDEQGRLHVGCNVENASFGITSCAERNAIAAAVAAGAKAIRHVLIYTPGKQAHAPCGACRQAIFELAFDDTAVFACCDSGMEREWLIGELLPDGFRFPGQGDD